jgi:glycopeptide antibiotics resistance protein
MGRVSRTTTLLTLVALVATALLTLLPGSPAPYRLIAEAVSPWVGPRRVAFVLNVALFVPLGALAGWRRNRGAFVAVVALSLLIETLQLVIPGRSPDPFDLVANGVGAVLGAYLVRIFRSARGQPAPTEGS